MTNAIVTLVYGAVAEGHGVLVFCESRKRCEDVGKLLVKFMPSVDQETWEKRMEVIRDLATTSTGLDFALEKTVPAGVAFHHAGLRFCLRDEESCGGRLTDWEFIRVDDRRERFNR